MAGQAPIHEQVLEAALRLPGARRTFRLRDLVAALPHLNPGTVRTHVASRCCVNASAHHYTRWPYFRAIGRGWYQVEARVSRSRLGRRDAWPDRLFERMGTGIDATLIVASLRLTPTERLERMRRAALSLEDLRANARRVAERQTR